MSEKKNKATRARKSAEKRPAERGGGRVPTDKERREKGQIRRTFRLSDVTAAKKWTELEKLHGGTAAVAMFFLRGGVVGEPLKS